MLLGVRPPCFYNYAINIGRFYIDFYFFLQRAMCAPKRGHLGVFYIDFLDKLKLGFHAYRFSNFGYNCLWIKGSMALHRFTI